MGTAQTRIEPAPPITLRRKLRFARTRLREWRMIAKGLLSKSHPILVHIIPIRRCNLSCTYCNEFDDFSKPVPLGEMKRRLDLLADMGTSIITISGGEPLLHPELDEVIAHIRRRSEEHTSELQSRLHLVCRLLLEKKKKPEMRDV